MCLHFLIRSERWEGNSRKLNIREPWLNVWIECGLVRMHRGHRLNAHEKHATTSNIVIWSNTTQENHAAGLRADSRKAITSNLLKRGNKIYLNNACATAGVPAWEAISFPEAAILLVSDGDRMTKGTPGDEVAREEDATGLSAGIVKWNGFQRD